MQSDRILSHETTKHPYVSITPKAEIKAGPASQHQNLILDKGFIIQGQDDGTIQIAKINDKEAKFSKPLVDFTNLKNKGGYCSQGFRLAGTLHGDFIFLLADHTSACPEFFVINLKKPDELQRIPFDNIATLTTTAKGRIILGLTTGEIYKSEQPYEADKECHFQLLGNHSQKEKLQTMAVLPPDSLVTCTSRELKIWDLKNNSCVRTAPLVESHYTMKAIPAKQFLLGSEHGLKVACVKTWSGQQLEGNKVEFAVELGEEIMRFSSEKDANVIDFAFWNGYVAEAIIDPEKSYFAEETKSPESKLRLKIKIFDSKSDWQCVAEYSIRRKMENNISLQWTPTGNILIYEKSHSALHHFIVNGIRGTSPAKLNLFSEQDLAQEKESDLEELLELLLQRGGIKHIRFQP